MSGQTVVILGGGISGLSAAFYLNKFCSHLSAFKKIIVLESSSHLGGWIKTHTFEDGVKHELGPKTIRVPTQPGYNVLSLVEDIGLADEVIGTSVKSIATQKRLILYNNELLALPNRIYDLFKRWKPLPKRFISYVLKDLRTKRLDLTVRGDDISVYDFISERMAPEIADYFIDPLCRGISAGCAKKLSAISMFPQMVRGEQEAGSIIGGAITNAQRDKLEATSSYALIQKAKMSRLSTITFEDGLQALPDRLCHFLLNLKGNPVEIYNESSVQKIEFNKETQKAKITVKTIDDTIELEADQVLSSIPAHNLAPLLPDYNELSDALREIQSVHMAVVNLEFKGKVMPKDAGFGYLVPSKEKSNILGTVFDSCVSPQFDGNKDITRLTVMMGGEWFKEVLGDINSVDKQLAKDIALDALRSHLKIESAPIRDIVSIHRDCIPQYYLGHRLRLEKINRLVKENSLNLILLGSSYQGFSVPDCILNSKIIAQKFADAILRINREKTSNESNIDSKLAQ